jgi:hypothetical protein
MLNIPLAPTMEWPTPVLFHIQSEDSIYASHSAYCVTRLQFDSSMPQSALYTHTLSLAISLYISIPIPLSLSLIFHLSHSMKLKPSNCWTQSCSHFVFLPQQAAVFSVWYLNASSEPPVHLQSAIFPSRGWQEYADTIIFVLTVCYNLAWCMRSRYNLTAQVHSQSSSCMMGVKTRNVEGVMGWNLAGTELHGKGVMGCWRYQQTE